jgi:hypothetical protein
LLKLNLLPALIVRYQLFNCGETFQGVENDRPETKKPRTGRGLNGQYWKTTVAFSPLRQALATAFTVVDT